MMTADREYRPGRRRALAAMAVALGACAWAAGAARADRLDDRLNANAPKIVEALHTQGVKNVGVLRFRVQHGDKPASFDVGPINGNLATRLENALVIHGGGDEKEALGVIHDAGKVAARHRAGNWYGNAAEQRKLFDIADYPLAWGSSKVKADAFLTGLVKVTPDYQHCTVAVELIRAPGKLEKVIDFNFESDPQLLADLGKSFSVSPRSLAAAKTRAARRKLVFDAVSRRDGEGEGGGGGGGGGGGSGSGGGAGGMTVAAGTVEFQLLADDNPVPITESGEGDQKAYQLECPDPGKQIVFSIHNTSTDKTVGVDVRLNGTTLLFDKADPAESSRLWVLGPGKTYKLKGYYLDEGKDGSKNVTPFKILVDDAAKAMREQLGDKAGVIQVTVFDQGNSPPEDTMQVSLRGPSPLVAKRASEKHSTYRAALMRSAALKSKTEMKTVNGRVVKRELIVKDEDEAARQNAALKAVDFSRSTDAPQTVTVRINPKAAK
jgi:hypothetical protein